MPAYQQDWDGVAADYADWDLAGSPTFSVGPPSLTSPPAALQVADSGASDTLIAGPAQDSPDGTLSAYIQFDGTKALGLVARLGGISSDPKAQPSYVFVVSENGASSLLFIEKFAGGGAAAVAVDAGGTAFAAAENTLYLAEFRLVGSSLKARLRDRAAGKWLKADGTWAAAAGSSDYVLSLTDASVAAAGRVGLLNSGAATGTVDDVIWDVAAPALSATTLAMTAGDAPATLSAAGYSDPLAGVTWASSDASVATVDASGAVTPVAAGTATITATGVADTSQSAACVVTVAAASGGGGPTLAQIVAGVWGAGSRTLTQAPPLPQADVDAIAAAVLAALPAAVRDIPNANPAANSLGAGVKATADLLAGSAVTPVESGTARGGGPASITLAASGGAIDLSANGGCWVFVKAGACCGQQARVTSFDPATRQAQVTPPWLPGEAPDATSTYDVMGPVPDGAAVASMNAAMVRALVYLTGKVSGTPTAQSVTITPDAPLAAGAVGLAFKGLYVTFPPPGLLAPLSVAAATYAVTSTTAIAATFVPPLPAAPAVDDPVTISA